LVAHETDHLRQDVCSLPGSPPRRAALPALLARSSRPRSGRSLRPRPSIRGLFPFSRISSRPPPACPAARVWRASS
jgi:hypothetical protein